MRIFDESDYQFTFKSNGVVVYYQNKYYGFYATLNQAMEEIFG